MPRIADHLLQCSFYLYPSTEEAKHGSGTGGSGFIVHVPSAHEGWIHAYAVTNSHVVDGGLHVLRLNTRDGKSQLLETKPESWTHLPGEDIAAMPLQIDSATVRWFSVSTEEFATEDRAKEYRLGPGDDIFMIGRLVTLTGYQKNTPVVRFGNISMMPDEPINIDGANREVYLVECRSMNGFSGSPVFVNAERTFSNPDIPQELLPPVTTGSGLKIHHVSTSGTFGPFLLGVNCAHLPFWHRAQDGKDQTELKIDVHAGFACVIPSWKLLRLLQCELFVQDRIREDAEIAKNVIPRRGSVTIVSN